MRSVKLLITGRVQGVFFRKATKQKADELTVLGTVRNLDEGHVEVFAQADAQALDIFIQWCHKGPMMARVDKVEIIEIIFEVNNYKTFEII